jgi:hypothetical protein
MPIGNEIRLITASRLGNEGSISARGYGPPAILLLMKSAILERGYRAIPPRRGR